jgi:glucose-1-phosphate thymidylyltransferase
MRILILAAGYGTRLYPLTNMVAKPLVEINGVPMLNFLIDKINRLKTKVTIEEVRIVANNKFYDSFLRWQEKYDVAATIVNDGSNSPDDRLGAIGDISFGIKGVADDWLIMGGDNLFEDSLEGFIDFSLRNRPAPSVGVYDVKNKEVASRCGVVKLSGDGSIIDFEEKPEIPSSTLVASCVYFFPRESFYLFQEFIDKNSNVDASGKYIEWLSRKQKAFGYALQGRWIDIGHIEALKEAEREFGSVNKSLNK